MRGFGRHVSHVRLNATLPPFPRGGAVRDTGALRRAALTLRHAVEADLPFLQALYATTRADEMAATPCPDDACAAFLSSQFALQHRHFTAHHPDGDFWLVTGRGGPVGRLYVDRTGPVWQLVDIALLPAAQGTGAGTALLRWLQRGARRAGAQAIDLQVLHTNVRAAGLYMRLGFTASLLAGPSHHRMTWRVPIG